MGRYLGPSCRLCRREGISLCFKGSKCGLVRRKSKPGLKAKKRMVKLSDYGLRLREKQKLKRIYGLREKQFYNFFIKAEKRKGKTGDNLLLLLERRLDNIVLRSHFARTRIQARQIVSHGHILVNRKKVNIASYLLKEGDVLELRKKSKNLGIVRESLKNMGNQGVVDWLEVDENEIRAKLKYIPSRGDIDIPVNEQVVVEFYSK